jgi:HTH-type transcriptional regulator/antitoxin HipB
VGLVVFSKIGFYAKNVRYIRLSVYLYVKAAENMSDTKQKVGRNIREARKAQGLTQEDLGKILGVSRVVISDYETGKQNLTLDTVDKVAHALGINSTMLLG